MTMGKEPRQEPRSLAVMRSIGSARTPKHIAAIVAALADDAKARRISKARARIAGKALALMRDFLVAREFEKLWDTLAGTKARAKRRGARQRRSVG